MKTSAVDCTPRVALPPLDAIDLHTLSPEQCAALRTAGQDFREGDRVLKKGGLNVVGEVLKGQGDFVEMEHYPRDDVFDSETHAQYYYHAHRGNDLEHGHFHTFLRAFCTNRWVTDETWYPAKAVIAMLDRFAIDHAFPNWAVNRWLTALLRLYRPHIEMLIHHRDQVVAAWQQAHPDCDVFEDRALEITGYLPIAVEDLLAQLDAL